MPIGRLQGTTKTRGVVALVMAGDMHQRQQIRRGSLRSAICLTAARLHLQPANLGKEFFVLLLDISSCASGAARGRIGGHGVRLGLWFWRARGCPANTQSEKETEDQAQSKSEDHEQQEASMSQIPIQVCL